nr:unnamed protein product [Wild carrot mottle virus]
MSILRKVVQFLDAKYSPAPGILSREQCAERYGADWAVLVTQERMTRALSEEHERWYSCNAETNVYIPVTPYVDPRDVVAPLIEDAASTGDAAPESDAGEPDAAQLVGEVVASRPATGPGPTPYSSEELESATPYCFTVEAVGHIIPVGRMEGTSVTREGDTAESDSETDTCSPAFYIGAGNAVPVTAANGEEGQPQTATPIPGEVPAFRAEDPTISRVPTTIVTGDAAEAMPTKVDDCDGSVSSSLMKAGPTMAAMDSYSVAMELRARFGLRSKTPANAELGGRVSREILSHCGGVRSEVYYLAQLAVQLWFAPTLLDLVLTHQVKDFC